MWKDDDPIALAVVFDDNASNDDDDAPTDPPMFLTTPPIPPNTYDLNDIDVAMVAPLPLPPVDVGARFDINQAPDQGVVYDGIDEESDANGNTEGVHLNGCFICSAQ